MRVQDAQFVKSASEPSELLRDGLPQIVFAGRSNVGKSSVINLLTGRRGLARTSSTPGKTSHVNYYRINGRAYFVDLPGYGFARVSKEEKARWARLMEAFFSRPEAVSLGLLVLDARRAPSDDDAMMAGWFLQTGRRLTVVANKADKLRSCELVGREETIRQALNLPEGVRVLLFSAETGLNKNGLLDEIEKYVRG